MLSENQVLVIAEIGSNHDGDLSKALELVDVAVVKLTVAEVPLLIRVGPPVMLQL